jgi:hypothetical protein
MPGPLFRAATAAVLLAALGACAATQSTERIVLRYNRAFSDSRNQVLVLNILRAAAREPLQFSTMGQVTGSVGNSSSISIPFTNILVGGQDSISPTLQIQDAVNPSISIVPLATKDFVSGILTPIGPDDVQLFLHTGWDADFLLPVVIGGVVCPDGRVILNSGEYVEEDPQIGTRVSDAFRDFFHGSAPTFAITYDRSRDQAFLLNDEQATALIRQGVGEGRFIADVQPAADGKKQIIIRSTSSMGVSGMLVEALCERLRRELPEESRPSLRIAESASVYGAVANRTQGEGTPREGRVIFRSVASIIHFLGESHRIRYRASTSDTRGLTYLRRDGHPQTLFQLQWGLGAGRRAVEVDFQDATFWIPAIDLRAGEGDDRTLKTLSFLDQLIALQTSADVVRGTQPLISVGQ